MLFAINVHEVISQSILLGNGPDVLEEVFLRICVCFPTRTAIAVDEHAGGPAQRLPLPLFWAEAGILVSGLEAAIMSARCFHQVACSLATTSSQRWQLGTILLRIAGCGGDWAGPYGTGKKRACMLVWGPGGAGRGAAELRRWVCPRAAGAGGWELPHGPLPPSGGCRRILL